MEEEIFTLVRKHLELLQLERDESVQHFLNDVSPAAIRNLERDGQALTKLQINSFASKGLECSQIDFVRSDGLPLKHALTLGDTVFCIQTSRKGQVSKALVSTISESTISITLKEQLDASEEELFTIVKTDSDFVYNCQTRALSNLEKKEIYSWRCFNIIKILFEKDKEIVCSTLNAELSIPKQCLDKDEKFIFSNLDLAEDQKAAVLFALRRKNFAIIQGPPGTGKTTTIVELIIQLCRLNKKVLVCAPTNVAVDNIVIKLGLTEVKPLRLGHPSRIRAAAHKYSLNVNIQQDDGYEILQDIKQSIKELKEKSDKMRGNVHGQIKDLDREYWKRMNKLTRDLVKRYSVILCTLNSATPGEGVLRYIPKDYFDVVIIDEASQALEASNWIAIPNAEKLVLAGDINQLPPVVMCQEAANRGLNLSLMERAIKKLGEDSFKCLQVQYRMNHKIMSWSSKQFYQNSLKADVSVRNHLLKDLVTVQNRPITSESLIFVDTCGCECEEYNIGIGTVSKGNTGEAVVVDRVITALIGAGVSEKDIGVITPYALQVDLIRRLLVNRSINVEVSTVDGFQGREKEAIVLSFVRSNEQKELGFVTDFKRLNVAVTRAKRLLAVIADSETVEGNKLISSLLNHIEKHGLLQTAQEYLTQDLDEMKERLEKGIITKQKPNESLIKSEKKSKSATKVISKNRTDDQVSKMIKDKGIDLSSDLNRKNYNPFENIAEDDEGEGTNFVVNKEDIEVLTNTDTTENVEREEESKEDIQLVKLIGSLNMSKDILPTGSTNTTSTIKLPITVKQSSNKKKKKCGTVKKTETIEEDDFNDIIAAVTSNDYICALKGCQKSTRLIHISCEFCKSIFCLQHGMQEVHGCGEAVRYKERKEFKHRKPEPAKERDKIKFARKLKQLEDARKPKKKAVK